MHRRSVCSYSLTRPRNEHPQPACFLWTVTADLNNVVGVLYCTSHLHPAPCELRGNLPLNLFGSNDTMEVEHRKLFVNVLQMFAYICNSGLNTTQMKSSPEINPLWPYWPFQSMWLPVRLAQCLLSLLVLLSGDCLLENEGLQPIHCSLHLVVRPIVKSTRPICFYATVMTCLLLFIKILDLIVFVFFSLNLCSFIM